MHSNGSTSDSNSQQPVWEFLDIVKSIFIFFV
jgi:hypothetical protein